MSVWKILVIGVLACASLAFAFATVAIPISHSGSDRWLWLGGLLAGTVASGTLLTFFLRYAGGSLDMPPRWAAGSRR
jgi:hypothetical protein